MKHDDKVLCPDCESSEVEYIRDDFDYDGNDRVHTWDVYLCLKCGTRFDVKTNDPYEHEGEDD